MLSTVISRQGAPTTASSGREWIDAQIPPLQFDVLNCARKALRAFAGRDLEKALRLLEGRWKLVILFHLFGGKIMRFSDLERAIPAITQKMLGQQLKAMEADGIVLRTSYPQVPPKVEYSLTTWGNPYVLRLMPS